MVQGRRYEVTNTRGQIRRLDAQKRVVTDGVQATRSIGSAPNNGRTNNSLKFSDRFKTPFPSDGGYAAASAGSIGACRPLQSAPTKASWVLDHALRRAASSMTLLDRAPRHTLLTVEAVLRRSRAERIPFRDEYFRTGRRGRILREDLLPKDAVPIGTHSASRPATGGQLHDGSCLPPLHELAGSLRRPSAALDRCSSPGDGTIPGRTMGGLPTSPPVHTGHWSRLLDLGCGPC